MAKRNPASKIRRRGKKLEKLGWSYAGNGFWQKHVPPPDGFAAASYQAKVRPGFKGFFLVYLRRPNNIINYACGVTGMRLRDYVIGTAIGFTPVLAVCVLFGASAVDLATALESGGPDREFSPLMIVGAVVLVFALVLVLARRYGPRLASPDPD